MPISKARIKSSANKHNEKFNKEPKTTIPLKGTTTNSTATTTTSLSSFTRLSTKTIERNKAKILKFSSSEQRKLLNTICTATPAAKASSAYPTTTTTSITAFSSTAKTTTTASTTTTTLLPQTNLLKIEPCVPSLTLRPNKIIRRSYSTLSNSTLKKLNNQHVNKIQYKAPSLLLSGRDAGNNKNINGIINGLPKVLRPPATLRRRPVLRGQINRQRSKSTSSSNSNSNRPTADSVIVNATTLDSSPYSAVVVQQPNGICRIQRNAKEQEKLPDRINYDKRGLTAIPIFENETNLRLLSLQHNLINTFHIPKEQERVLQKEQEQEEEKEKHQTTKTEAAHKEQTINISGNQAHQHFGNNKQKLPAAVAKANVEVLQPQAPGQLMLPLNASTIKSPLTFGSYILQSNKLLHKSINMNNCQPNSHSGNLQHPAQLHFSMHKSKSFVSNQNLQLNVTKRSMQNQRSALLRRSDAMGNLKSFDSSTSNITTDSTQSTLLTTETDDSQMPEEEEEGIRSVSSSPLAITNKQLAISYGNIFKNLVFLDLYDNQIERISNLDGLTTLTVLLLGKNRISDITGLSSLKSTLRVLDLHGNKLCSISNKINCLQELKSLNLAGNQIRQINHNDFLGLHNLKELNLKRNKLKRINGFQHLLALERLWLCHNDLHKVDDMSTIAKAQNLIEITIENNPLTLAGDCVSFLVSYLPKLQTLSQMPITEQVRKAAMTWRTTRELSEANSSLSDREIFNTIRREEIISNARTNWELLRSQQTVQNALRTHKNENESNKDLQKIAEATENNYEEFIKLPPIISQLQQPTAGTNSKETEERSSSASASSSLGPNINSSSSCYSSQDEDDAGVTSRVIKPTNNIDNPSMSSINSKEQKRNTKNETLPTANNDQHQHHCESSQSMSKCNNKTIIETTSTPTIASVSNCAPTLNLQFPMETSRVSANQQNQAVTSTTITTTSVSSSISSTQTVTAATVSSSTGVASTAPASVTLTKRCMTGGLMRSQTIVGTVTGAGGVAIGFGGNSGGYTNGYMVKTNNVATANNIRWYQSKLNPNATTQTAALTTLQQTITVTAATVTATAATAVAAATIAPTNVIVPMTMITTPTTTIALAIPNNNANNSLMASSTNSSNTSSTSNANKTLVSGAANSITGIITAQTTAAIAATGPCGGTSTKLTAIEREREQGGDYLIEICGRYLNIYGQGALRFIDKQWSPTKANDVHTLNFSYINFNNIASILGRIKVRFVHAENFVFRETNINCLGQLNALAELQGISSLTIDDEGNPITGKNMWRQYAIYRLSHWGLKTLNNIEVTEQEIEEANALYAGLSDLILWSMPDAMLQPLLTRLRLEETCSASKLMPKQWLSKPDNKSLRLVVGKEALQWQKTAHVDYFSLPESQQNRHSQYQYYNRDSLNQTLASTSTKCNSSLAAVALTAQNVALTTRERGKIHFTLMMENTCNAVEKLHKLEQIWPHMLQNIVRNTLLDYSQLDVYVRNLMAEIMK